MQRDEAIDGLFAKWNSSESPGCAVGVYRSGQLEFGRAFGMADLTHHVPIGLGTPFHVASLSKQFTAAAVFLLEQQSRVALGADIRDYLPELGSLPSRVEVRDLLYHTSGLRDQWVLLELSGWRYSRDLITADDVMEVVRRQKGLNFIPGEQHAYSNTGYTLLAAIVSRVSGLTFAEFTRAQIFAPLGMHQSGFRDDHAAIVPNNACGYEWNSGTGRFQIRQTNFDTVGATSLHTTVEDLERWEANFYDAGVGGVDLVHRLLTPGTLRNGQALAYAGGVMLGTYRGLRTVRHGGADAGFRAELLRFPEQRLAVAILGNAADIPAGALARRVAEHYLNGEMTPGPPADWSPSDDQAGPTFEVTPAVAGTYWHREHDHFISVIVGSDGVAVLESGQRIQMTPVGRLTLECVDLGDEDRVTFAFEETADGTISGVDVHFGNSGMRLVFEAQGQIAGDTDALTEYEGNYASDELASIHRFEVLDGRLSWCRPRHPAIPLDLAIPDVFSSVLGTVRFQRDSRSRVTGFVFGSFKARGLRFVRLEERSPGLAAPVHAVVTKSARHMAPCGASTS